MMNEYPENHGYAHLEYYARDAQVYYNIGLAYERVGDRRNAGNISKWRRRSKSGTQTASTTMRKRSQ